MKHQKSRYIRFAEMAYHLSKRVLPKYSHQKSPHYFTWPQLNACVLIMMHNQLTYRDMEEWLIATDQVCKVLDLQHIPDHTTLYRAFKRLTIALLTKMYRNLLDELAIQEEAIVFDTTGFSPTQASMHYLARSGVRYEQFIKGAYAVGVQTQFILTATSGIGPAADTGYLEPLRRQSARYARGRPWIVIADRGFDSVRARETDLIPPIRRNNVLRRPDRIARFELVSAARLDGLYGQRWKVETVNSVIKRKFGDDVRSRKPIHRHREPIVKGLVYNLYL
ncbi:IS4/IS5 family transposase [bacterium]|nr:IS4/IS5 family transposase [bacterium]TLM98945.1 MAG: transposase [bacterium]